MKISKEQWREMALARKPVSESLADLHHRPPYSTRTSEADNSKADTPLQCDKSKYKIIDVVEEWDLGFHCSSAISYIAKSNVGDEKIQDIEKAVWHLQRHLAMLKNRNKGGKNEN